MPAGTDPPQPADRATSFPWSAPTETSAIARSRARAFLADSVPPLTTAAVEDILIVVSEMVANAVRHAPGPGTLALTDNGTDIIVAVTDTSDLLPQPRPPGLTTGTGGFGWHLLHTLAAHVRIAPDPRGGKTITAYFPYAG